MSSARKQDRHTPSLWAILVAFMIFAFLESCLVAAQRAKQTCRSSRSKGQYELPKLETKLELGARIEKCIIAKYGEEFYQRYKTALSGRRLDEGAVKMPRGFWPNFIVVEMQLKHTVQQRLRCYRALRTYIERTSNGELTFSAMCAGRRRHSKRKRGGEYNASKARGLGHALCQFFVDEIQVLKSRADSIRLLEKAAELRQIMVDDGWSEKDLLGSE